MSTSNFSIEKFINWVLFIIFSLFALVQLNDPDPMIWVFVYGLVAVLFGISNFVKVPKQLILIIIIALGLFAAFQAESFYVWLLNKDKAALFDEMNDHKPYLEGTREFLGILISIASLLYLLKKSI